MLATATRRTLLNAKVPVNQVRLISSVPTPPRKEEKKSTDRRDIHSSARQEQADVATTFAAPQAKSFGKTVYDRMVLTAEVTVSKIFPAGFGWQTASVIADGSGMSPESLSFALTTGAGDAVGVLMGHCSYYAAKKAITGSESINMTQELHTGVLLGSAAFCSGTAWQPIVNALQGANLPFSQVFIGTWIGCGAAFYAGLRVGRTILSGPLKYIEEPSYDNSKNDLALSTAIGGATGFFVGTDAAYLPEQNFLIDIVGIQDGTPDLAGAAIAGTSTAMGFLTAQTAMNVVYPTGKSWTD